MRLGNISSYKISKIASHPELFLHFRWRSCFDESMPTHSFIQLNPMINPFHDFQGNLDSGSFSIETISQALNNLLESSGRVSLPTVNTEFCQRNSKFNSSLFLPLDQFGIAHCRPFDFRLYDKNEKNRPIYLSGPPAVEDTLALIDYEPTLYYDQENMRRILFIKSVISCLLKEDSTLIFMTDFSRICLQSRVSFTSKGRPCVEISHIDFVSFFDQIKNGANQITDPGSLRNLKNIKTRICKIYSDSRISDDNFDTTTTFPSSNQSSCVSTPVSTLQDSVILNFQPQNQDQVVSPIQVLANSTHRRQKNRQETGTNSKSSLTYPKIKQTYKSIKSVNKTKMKDKVTFPPNAPRPVLEDLGNIYHKYTTFEDYHSASSDNENNTTQPYSENIINSCLIDDDRELRKIPSSHNSPKIIEFGEATDSNLTSQKVPYNSPLNSTDSINMYTNEIARNFETKDNQSPMSSSFSDLNSQVETQSILKEELDLKRIEATNDEMESKELNKSILPLSTDQMISPICLKIGLDEANKLSDSKIQLNKVVEEKSNKNSSIVGKNKVKKGKNDKKSPKSLSPLINKKQKEAIIKSEDLTKILSKTASRKQKSIRPSKMSTHKILDDNPNNCMNHNEENFQANLADNLAPLATPLESTGKLSDQTYISPLNEINATSSLSQSKAAIIDQSEKNSNKFQQYIPHVQTPIFADQLLQNVNSLNQNRVDYVSDSDFSHDSDDLGNILQFNFSR